MEKTILKAVQDYFEECKKGVNNFISSEELVEVMENKEEVFILDIRKPKDFEKACINGAYNIFWHDLGECIDILPKEKKIVVACYSGQSSGQVVSLLKVLGFEAVSLSGGMNNGWLKSGMKTSSGCAA